jgi:large subunit ribosomal protein L9
MTTQVILLERVENLGQMGDVVAVKPGYARNFLLPQKKALRATKANVAFFETQRKVLEANNLKRKSEAESMATKLNGLKVTIIRQASESGQMFGSVSSRDIADAVTESGIKVERNQVLLNQSFKLIGLFPVFIALHPEVKVEITLNIARSVEEAKMQEKSGKALIIDPNQRDAPEREVRGPKKAKAAEDTTVDAPAAEAASDEAAA